jgi:hypothetical protein
MEPAKFVVIVLTFSFFVLLISAIWTIFTKAKKPGWAALIPIYNMVVLLQIVGRPWWWVFFMVIPLVNIIFGIIVNHDLARSFAKSGLFTLGLIFLTPIFLPILAFGNARYIGPAGRRR